MYEAANFASMFSNNFTSGAIKYTCMNIVSDNSVLWPKPFYLSQQSGR